MSTITLKRNGLKLDAQAIREAPAHIAADYLELVRPLVPTDLWERHGNKQAPTGMGARERHREMLAMLLEDGAGPFLLCAKGAELLQPHKAFVYRYRPHERMLAEPVTHDRLGAFSNPALRTQAALYLSTGGPVWAYAGHELTTLVCRAEVGAQGPTRGTTLLRAGEWDGRWQAVRWTPEEERLMPSTLGLYPWRWATTVGGRTVRLGLVA